MEIALIGSVRGGKGRYQKKRRRESEGSLPGHIGTPINCYRLIIDIFDKAVAKYIEDELDKKV